MLCSVPDGLLLPAQHVLQRHLLPEDPLLLDVEVAGREVLEVGEGAGGQRGVNAGRHGQGRAWRYREISCFCRDYV